MEAGAHSRYRELLVLVSDSSRWRILQLLRSHPLTVRELVERMEIAQPAVSHHLGRLRRAGLVRSTTHGRSSRYEWTTGDAGSAVAELHVLLDRWFGKDMAPSAPASRHPRSGASMAPIEVHLL